MCFDPKTDYFGKNMQKRMIINRKFIVMRW